MRYSKEKPRCQKVWYHYIEACCYSNEHDVERVQFVGFIIFGSCLMAQAYLSLTILGSSQGLGDRSGGLAAYGKAEGGEAESKTIKK